MKLAVSNIAWEAPEDDAVAKLLANVNVRGVEIAPTKWRDDPYEAPAEDVAAYRRYWEDRGLVVASLQALLFGKPDLHLFGTESSRATLLDYLKRSIDFAAGLGATALVFGSPKNRLRGELALTDAMYVATDFLRELGDHARDRGALFCVEANPPAYGCDFITRTSEAVELCRRVAHPNIRVNADLGGMIMADEDPKTEVIAGGSFVGHAHASEPHLAEFATTSLHRKAAEGLREIGYDRWVSIEMRAPGGDNLGALARAIRRAKTAYGGTAAIG
jgi:D-psicose/D-tagatose/L-ribulose 3-epimerase